MLIEKLTETKNYISQKFELSKNTPHKIGLILGSGLSPITEFFKTQDNFKKLNYQQIPHFSNSSVSGHAGELIKTNNLLILSGRLHAYEGYTPQETVFPLQVLSQLGVKIFILTNASGAILDKAEPGDFMLIRDHINLTGRSPLTGTNFDSLGPRFVDMSNAYSTNLRTLARDRAHKLNITLHEGVYAGVYGPNFETPAEVLMLQKLGADAVGMSTVFETIALRHMRREILGISCFTNKAAGLSTKPLSHEEVLENNLKAAQKLGRLIQAIINNLENY